MAYLGQHGLKRDFVMSLCGQAVIQLAKSRNWDSLDKLVTAFQEKVMVMLVVVSMLVEISA